jgi:PAS domain S-box-containing protein
VSGITLDRRDAGPVGRRYSPVQWRRLAALAVLLFAFPLPVYALFPAVDDGALLFAPAVLLAGVLAGPAGGALAGLAACALYGAAEAIGGDALSILSLGCMAAPLAVVGAVVGRLSTGLNDKSDEAARAHEDADAVEATFRAVFQHALDGLMIFDDDGRILEANGAMAALVGVPRTTLIGSRIGERASPDRRSGLAALWRAFEEAGTLRDEYEFVTADGAPRCVEFTATAEFLSGRHLAVVRDCTERRRSQHALEQRASQQAAIADLGLLALEGLGPDQLMDDVSRRVASTLDVDRVWILERSSDDERLHVRAGHGWPAGVTGRALLPSDETALLEEHGVLSGLRVTILRGETPWGVLGVYCRSPREFTGDDATFLRAVANTLAMAIDRRGGEEELLRRSAEIARLAAERQRIVGEVLDAEDRTRERISQQLHDELLQQLFVIRQDLAQAASTPQRGDLVPRARDRVGHVIRQLRSAVVDLHPVVLEQGGLRSAIRAVTRHHAELGGFDVSIEIDAEDADGALARLVVSLIRVLLSNVARHADARHATVRLRRVGDELVLEVSDDGRGMEPDQARQALASGHIGLASTAQRVEALGGRLEVLSGAGRGTTVRAALPFAA